MNGLDTPFGRPLENGKMVSVRFHGEAGHEEKYSGARGSDVSTFNDIRVSAQGGFPTN